MELVRLHSRGGFSVRSIVTFCLAVIMAVFFGTTTLSTVANAQPAAATWQNESTILYDGHAFQANSSLINDTLNLPDGASIYTYVEPAGQSATATRGAYFIYFASGVDPPTATSAEYVRYTYVNETFSNPQDQTSIQVTPFGQESEYSSCEVSGGLGWIICPVTIFLANTMDSLFDLVTNFLAVKPLTLDTGSENGLYNVWNIMRNIANIAFVVAFLIIIYTQITGMGVSSYGMKKMIPRLVIAAILVNVSFVISALAIDISNILGFSVQDIFVWIRENTFYMTDDTTAGNIAFNSGGAQWGLIAAAVLGGGGALWASIATGTIFFLLPLLASLALTLFVVLVVLAARQAIIIVLVIVAPLAFVANLLPNTEKWFGKWRDLFMTMLIFFPAFSLIFGGSQLAGQIIIQNAGDDLIMAIFGMAVQVAPLVVTPLLLKLSGNLLGKIMQIANNPNKGLVDRTRNFSKGMADQRRNKTLGQELGGRKKKDPRTWMTRGVQGSEHRRRRREDRTAAYKQEADNRYHESPKYEDVFNRTQAANDSKEALHNEHLAHYEKLRNTKPAPGTKQRRNYESIYDRGIRAEASKDALATQQAHTAGHYDTLRTVGGTPLNASRNRLEAAKTNAEAAAQNLTAYQSEQRTFKSTDMGKAAINLETAKLNAEGQQSNYTAHIDDLKLKPGSTLNTAARFAQSSKEHAEKAQLDVQAMFDRQRSIKGTDLNITSTSLQDAQLRANEAKSLADQFFSESKSKEDGVLHVQNVKTEAAKVAFQKSEAQLTRVVEEYKSGKTEGAGDLREVVETMVDNVVEHAAEARGAQAAQNMQKYTVASAFTAGDTRAEELLKTAASVDPQGKVRAEASAINQLDSIEDEGRKNIVTLLGSRAKTAKMTSADYAKHLFNLHRGAAKDPESGALLNAKPQDSSVLEAALDMMASDGDVGNMRKARMDDSIDQDLLDEVIARNRTTLMSKGGFDLQADPSLRGADKGRMDTSIAFSLGSVTAEKIADQKFGWWQELSNEIPSIIESTKSYIRYPDDPVKQAQEQERNILALRRAHANMTRALRDPGIMARIGDRAEETIRIHKALQSDSMIGNNNAEMLVDYDAIRIGRSGKIKKKGHPSNEDEPKQ